MTAEECVREYNHGLLRPASPDNSAMSVSVRFARVNHASLIFGISRLRLFRALLFYDSRDKTSAEKQATNGFMSVGKAAKKKNFASLSRAEPVSRSPLLLFLFAQFHQASIAFSLSPAPRRPWTGNEKKKLRKVVAAMMMMTVFASAERE